MAEVEITKEVEVEAVEGSEEELEIVEQDSKDARAIGITRLVVSLVTIINVVAQSFGWSPIPLEDGELVYTAASSIVAIIAIVWAWWKNNNMTKAAQVGQLVINELKGK